MPSPPVSSSVVLSSGVESEGGLPAAAMASVRTFQLADESPATAKAYRGDAQIFDAWCRGQGLPGSIPAAPETVAAFLAAEAERGVKASTIGAGRRRSPMRTSCSASPTRPRTRA